MILNNKIYNKSTFESKLNLDVHCGQFIDEVFHNIRDAD